MIRRPYLISPVTSSQLSAAKVLLGDLHHTLSPLPNLTSADRKRCIKVGDYQAAFIEEIHALCKSNPKIMPQWHDLHDFYACMESLENLQKLQLHMMSIMETIDGALLGAKHDAMVYCLDYFHNLKIATKSGMPGLGKHLEKAKGHFKGGNRRKKDQIPDSIPVAIDQAADAAKVGGSVVVLDTAAMDVVSPEVEKSITSSGQPDYGNSYPLQAKEYDSTSKHRGDYLRPKPMSPLSRSVISGKVVEKPSETGNYRKKPRARGGKAIQRRKAR